MLYLDNGKAIIDNSIIGPNNVDSGGKGRGFFLTNCDSTMNTNKQDVLVRNSTFVGDDIVVAESNCPYEVDGNTFKGFLLVQDSHFTHTDGRIFDVVTHPAQGEVLFDNVGVTVVGANATYAIGASSVVVLRGRKTTGAFNWAIEVIRKSWHGLSQSVGIFEHVS